jgi:hypothetical protein
MADLGRRAFLVAVALFSPLASFDSLTLSLSKGELAQDRREFTLDDFLALSSRLTGRTNLDRAAADVLLKALRSKPGYDARLARPDAALEREIIVAWYTGTYEIGAERRLFTHTGSLQWRAIGLPVPGGCAGRFGAWSQAPRS